MNSRWSLIIILILNLIIQGLKINVQAQVVEDSIAFKQFDSGSNFNKVQGNDSVIYYFKHASNVYLQSGDTVRALRCDYDLVSKLEARKEDISALNLLHKAGTKYKNWFKNHPLQGAEYQYKIGEKYTDNLKFDSAVMSYNSSLSLWLRIGKDSVKQIKDVYKAIAYVYSYTGQYDSAILYLQKSIVVYSSKYGIQNKVGVNTYLSMGNAYFYKGEISKGIDLFRKALKINLNISDFLESDLAWIYNSLGISYYVKKDFKLALLYIQKASDLFIKIYGEKSTEVAWCYNNIGICYQEMKDDDQAYFFQDKALKIRLAINGENHPDVASSYNNLGVICEDKKDYINELGFFKKALDIRKHFFSEINQDIAVTYSNIGSTFMLMHQYDSAFCYYDKALPILLNYYKESTSYLSEIYVHLSQINIARANYTTAFENIRKSIAMLVPTFTSPNIADNPKIDDIYNYPAMIRALENKANALQVFYERQSNDPADLEKCLSVYRLISDISDRFSHQLREEGAKLLAEGNAREIFGEAVKVSYRLSIIKRDMAYKEKAFYYAEKARASVLSEAMNETNMRHFAGISDSLLSLEKKIRVDKADCEIKLMGLKQQKGLADSSYVKTLENKYFELTSQYQQLIDSFEIKFPVYQYLRNVPTTMSSKDIIDGLDSKTALFEYLLTGDSLFVFAFNHKDFRVATVPVDSVLKQKFHDYPRDIRKLKTEAFIKTSRLLYKYLIMPVIEMSEGCDRLIIIPDGQLFYIPFETLVASESKASQSYSDLDYLIKHYDVSYHYSANLWLHNKNLIPEKSKPLDGFIGFAPVFKKDWQKGNIISADLTLIGPLKGETAIRSASSGGKKFNELIYTEKEISSIVELFARKNLQAKGYLFAEANEENFKNMAGNYKYVHIASHGFCDDKEPNLSGIAFYQTKQDSTELQDLPDEINEKNEGILYSGETYNLKLNADLIVLSACESGAGTLMKGEGMMGLSRGFLFSGVPNIIYSLWKIGDLNTSQLMADFYKYMLQKNNYAHALRLAKLNLISSEATAFPKFWSSFELVGQ